MSRIGFLILNMDFGGGAETVTKTLAERFAKDHQVVVISIFKAVNSSDSENLAYKYILDIPAPYTSLNAKKYQSEIFAFLNKEKLDVLIVQTSSMAYYCDFKTLMTNSLSIVVQHFNPISFFDIRANPRYYLSVDYNLKKRILKTIAYPLIYCKNALCKPKEYKNFLSTATDHSDCYVMLCDSAKEATKKFLNGEQLEKVEIIPNSISITENHNFVKKNKTALYVGRIEKEKGAMDLIRVWKRISKKHPDAILKLAGSFQDDELKAKITNMENVEIVGYQKDMSVLYQQADVLLHLSYSEGLPMVIMESLAQGVIPIAFDCNFGPKDLIDHNQTGFVIYKRKIKRFVKTLDTWFNMNNLEKDKFREKAIESTKKYSVDQIYTDWMKLITKYKN